MLSHSSLVACVLTPPTGRKKPRDMVVFIFCPGPIRPVGCRTSVIQGRAMITQKMKYTLKALLVLGDEAGRE